MASKRLTHWFVTERGKTFSHYVAGTVTIGVLVGNFLPQTILLDEYKDIIRLYKNGMSVPVSRKLRDRFDTALKLLEVDPVDEHLYQPFHSFGFDVMSAGSSYSKYGVIVGLPVNFTYDDINQVDKPKIKVNQESVLWETVEGKKLLNSLVLSENAQIYAMAREIRFRQTLKPLLDIFIAVNSCFLAYGTSIHINTKFNYYAKPFSSRLIIYFLVGIFVVGTYTMSKDMTQLYYEEQIDRELKEKSKLLSEGGKEFYSKLIERNKALRKLLGKEGERLYSVLGNENYFIRNRHLPLVQRKSLFEEQLQS